MRLVSKLITHGGRNVKECEIVYNTKWGYCFTPAHFNSIAEALRDAREQRMAFRVFVDGKCVRRGWYA